MKPHITTLTTCLFLFAQAFGATGGKPSIIFILADDIGYGDFGCYGATKVQTPNIDQLATQGLLLTEAHSMASVGQVDMLAGFATHTGQQLAPADGPDSDNVLPALLGRESA